MQVAIGEGILAGMLAIDPIEVTEVERNDVVEIFCPYPGGQYTGPDGRTYDKVGGGQVTRINVEVAVDGWTQAAVFLDTDPEDTTDEKWAGTLVGGGPGNLIFGIGYRCASGDTDETCYPNASTRCEDSA